MLQINLKIATAVAISMSGYSVAQTSPPSPAQCALATTQLYVAGSSAAQSSIAEVLGRALFDLSPHTVPNRPTMVTLSATNGNFKAYCGLSNGAGGITYGTVVAIYYRGEGDSIMAVLPIVSGKPIKFLDISQKQCQVASPVTTGTAAGVGPTDGWGGCVTTHAVEMGVTDLEPTVFTPPNYPSVYSTTVFGTASSSQLSNLASTALFGQVFGIYVNTSGLTLSGPLNLSRETVSNILAGNYTDWSAVPSANGGRVSTTSAAIHLVNSQAGSGTRAGASIYFLGTNCSNYPIALSDPSPLTDGYSTGDVLTTAAATPGAITYASIDNVKAGLTLAQLSGITPTNLAAASGQYDWWFEATALRAATISSPNGASLYFWLTTFELQNVSSAPHTADVLAIPNVGTNIAAVPVAPNTLYTNPTIYINPFLRAGNSCNSPFEEN